MPAPVPASGEPLLEFLEVMRRLRAECAWKREQTHRSLARYLLEETHETLDAIDAGAASGDWAHLEEELGDLLLQVYFHAVIGEESGAFTIDDVARGITEKMRRRNPHVFGDAADRGAAAAMDAADVNDAWQAVKAAEKPGAALTDGISPTLPALLYADKVLDRLERRAPQSVAEEVAQQPSRSRDLGDRLLALVAEARTTGTDPEQALRDAVRRLLPSP
ncbi:XTP/dITP diphosphohydrolase [Nocardioides ginsengisegetis]|uniref:XTP/dITP diphosphohydrolase n=1 Tax=Nocardioides ginsengisegetis TaxID=661491 RepID=A0A7W3J1R7_9ACTN|nr:XTP/dITP diphosphohydrolase [Nocardioides ginsengisegetis]